MDIRKPTVLRVVFGVLKTCPNKVLLTHIRDKLPDMKARLNTLMGQAQQELNSFGDAAIYGDRNQVRCSIFIAGTNC